MIDFSKDAIFNLRKIDNDKINKNIPPMLIEGEAVIGVYHTVRDQVVFTNKRIITIDIQGVTGMRKEIFTLPYANVQYYAIQTVGFAEVIPDAELALFFSNGMKASFEFRGRSDIVQISKIIGTYVLAK